MIDIRKIKMNKIPFNVTFYSFFFYAINNNNLYR